MKAKAYAKINLTLDITGKREDGYHTLETVMQSVSLCDDIEISLIDEPEIKLTTSLPYIPTDERNTAYKAAKLYFDETGASGGVKIDVVKNIPSRAGMGGGSADAAAVLNALNKLHGERLSMDELLRIGEKIGADVPFCMLGGTYKCEEIGEVMTKTAPMPSCQLVICKPPYGMSTPRAYSIVDEYELSDKGDTAKMISALESGDIEKVANALGNRFDEILRMRQVRELKRLMKESGALNAMMTGSGSAVFAVFSDKELADICAERLKESKLGEVFVVTPMTTGTEIV